MIIYKMNKKNTNKKILPLVLTQNQKSYEKIDAF